MTEIESIREQALADIAAAASPDAVEGLRVALLGKSGSVTALRLSEKGTEGPALRIEIRATNLDVHYARLLRARFFARAKYLSPAAERAVFVHGLLKHGVRLTELLLEKYAPRSIRGRTAAA